MINGSLPSRSPGHFCDLWSAQIWEHGNNAKRQNASVTRCFPAPSCHGYHLKMFFPLAFTTHLLLLGPVGGQRQSVPISGGPIPRVLGDSQLAAASNGRSASVFLLLKGVLQNPSINQPMEKGHSGCSLSHLQLWRKIHGLDWWSLESSWKYLVPRHCFYFTVIPGNDTHIMQNISQTFWTH